MLGEELRPGLRTWTDLHEEWTKQVRSFAVVEDERLTLVDPLIPEDGWDDLAATRGERALEVLVTIHWHVRSAAAIRGRHPDARVWAWSGDRDPIAERVAVDRTFEAGEELPGGLVAIEAGSRQEVLFWDRAHRALLAGDVLLGDGESAEQGEPSDGLHLCPESWVTDNGGMAGLRAALRGTLDLPIELVLPSHGALVLADGHAALAAALD